MARFFSVLALLAFFSGSTLGESLGIGEMGVRREAERTTLLRLLVNGERWKGQPLEVVGILRKGGNDYALCLNRGPAVDTCLVVDFDPDDFAGDLDASQRILDKLIDHVVMVQGTFHYQDIRESLHVGRIRMRWVLGIAAPPG